MKIKVRNLHLLFLYSYTFLVIYTPHFFSKATYNYILPFIYTLIGYFFLKRKKENNKIITTFNICWIAATIFVVIRAIIAGVSITDISNLRIVQHLVMLSSVYSIYFIERNLDYWNYDTKKKIYFLLNVCMIQFFIVFIMILFPNFRANLLKIFYVKSATHSFTMAKRVYGIMFNYTYAGAIFHGFMASVCLLMTLYNDRKAIKYIPFLLIIVLLNGRTGLFIFLICSITIIFFNFMLNTKKLKIIKILITSMILVIIPLYIIKIYKPDTYNFFVSGITESINFITTGKSNNYNENTKDLDILYYSLKQDFNTKVLILGAGHKIQNSGDIPNNITFTKTYSDMGFLNDMYIGGIFYMLLIYFPILYMVKINCKNPSEKLLTIIILEMIFISNIKGEVFRSSILIDCCLFVKLAWLNKEDVNEKSISNNVNI